MTTALKDVSTVPMPGYTAEDIKLVRDTVAKGADENEFKLFLTRCKLLGLNPLKPGQIHFVKYGNSPGTIVVGIEGFRAKAQGTGKLSGIKRGAIRNDKGELVGGWAEVYRADWKEPAREEAPLSEYSTGRGPWQKMPETMIKKVAEAAALRMAFPDDLGGVYTNEEMDQAAPDASPPGRVFADQPGENDGVKPPSSPTKPKSGSMKGRSLAEYSGAELTERLEYLFSINAPSDDQLREIENIQHFLDTLYQVEPPAEELPVQSEKPRCTCGSSLILSTKKNVYYCSNFKDASRQHIRSIPKADYENM